MTHMNEHKDKKPVKKGFYAALYSCVGVMLAVAAVIGYFNYRVVIGDPEGSASATERVEAVAVNGPEETPLPQTGVFGFNGGTDIGAATNAPVTPTTLPAATANVKPTTLPAATPGAPATLPGKLPAASPATLPAKAPDDTIVVPAPKDEYLVDDKNNLGGAEDRTTVTQSDIAENGADSTRDTERTSNPADMAAEPPAPSVREFTAFNDDDRMLWPLFGDVVMDYSADRTIFDPTLEHFRTNKTLCIAAYAGEPVCAAADGVVKDVFYSRETGTAVTIDHGNGWLTTYSRLNDDTSVSVGDVVYAGETIATVGEPPIFAVLLGNHLGFDVSKDYASVDPSSVLVARQ